MKDRSHLMWIDEAECFGMENKFDGFSGGHVPMITRELCFGCPVKIECRLAGIGEQYGVWGNANGNDLRTLRDAVMGRKLRRNRYKDSLEEDQFTRDESKRVLQIRDRGYTLAEALEMRGFSRQEINALHEDNHNDLSVEVLIRKRAS